MRTLWKQFLYELRFLARYIRALIFGFFTGRKYKGLENFCLFIGYPRSGHSLIASLLDAHPNTLIGMEWCVMSHLKQNYRRKQIFYSIWQNTIYYKTKKENSWTGYSYKVPNSWQGSFKQLKVIGDKKGGRTSLFLREQPELLLKLKKTVGLNIKLIHVIRNPFDVITTMTIRSHQRQKLPGQPESMDLLPFIKGFFSRADVVKDLIEKKEFEIYNLFSEKFIANPQQELKQLVEYLGLEANQEYISNCCSIVYSEPHQSRKKIPWSTELVVFVENKLLEYPFLSNYKFNN